MYATKLNNKVSMRQPLDVPTGTKLQMITTAKNRLRNQPGYSLLSNGEKIRLETTGEIRSFGRIGRNGKIYLTIPRELLEYNASSSLSADKPGLLWPFGEDFTLRIAKSIFRNGWVNRSFGIIPGEYHFEDGALCFNGDLESSRNAVTSILLYADTSMITYSGEHGLITFNFANSDLYGLILPLNFLVEEGKVFVGSSATAIRDTLDCNIRRYRLTSIA